MVAKVGNKFFQHTPEAGRLFPLILTVTPLVLLHLPRLPLVTLITYEVDDFAAAIGEDLTGKSNIKILWGYVPTGKGIRYGKALKFNVAGTPSDSCPAGTSVDGSNASICVLSGTYTEDLYLTNNFDYRIEGTVRIGDDNSVNPTLTIEPGVTTYGTSGNDFLWIDRGAKLIANGTPSAPIIMTSASDADATATTRGEWGGLVINGNAPINGCSEGTELCESAGEGNSGLFGGNDAEDDSGSLTYLVVKYAGFLINDLDELNGIAFQGVGSGTNVDYVQVHNNQDDGVEFFGGTVNAKASLPDR